MLRWRGSMPATGSARWCCCWPTRMTGGRGPIAEPAALRELVERRDALSLRQAMALLSWGPVADYFAHRWTDPTFLAGLALVEAHGPAPRTAFELACGIGHHLRELACRGVAVTGVDVVFAKLWVARHWVLPEARGGGAQEARDWVAPGARGGVAPGARGGVAPGARGGVAPGARDWVAPMARGRVLSEPQLLCLDAAQDWPVAGGGFDLVACHDAFYFMEPKGAILVRLQALLSPGGVLAIGHVHNRDAANLSAGHGMRAMELGPMFPGAVLYDDAELTRALAEGLAPAPATAAALERAEAFAIAMGPGLRPTRPVVAGLALPPAGAALTRNPLYDAAGNIAWPSPRYGQEYGPLATYPLHTAAPLAAVHDAAHAPLARRRELVHLPERW